MNNISHICIVTPMYPTPKSPAQYAFVDQLACAMADLGNKVTVICPIPLGRKKSRGFISEKWERKTEKGNEIIVYQPLTVSVTNNRIGPIDLGKISDELFYSTIRKVLQKIEKPTFLYGHFLNPAGITVAKLGNQLGIPSYCAFGESGLWSINYLDRRKVTEALSYLSGIVSVSSENKKLLVGASLFPEEKIGVFPNGTDLSSFSPKDKQDCRKKLGFPKDDVIGIFVGGFIERKGPLRVQEAVKDIPNLRMIYAGVGEQDPIGRNIIFKGRIAHDKLPEYLSAADFFVLPTLAEGCCNAIVEAMACGLPIISSIGGFNDDILDEKYAIRIDPKNVEEIRMAVMRLIENGLLRNEMSKEAFLAAQKLSISGRAERIIQFMCNNA